MIISHTYQRTCPVINGTCVFEGKRLRNRDERGLHAAPVHIVSGSGGAHLGHELGVWPDYIAVLDDKTYGTMQFETARTWLRGAFVDSKDGHEVDSFVFEKDEMP
jgi:hypothetical protein